MRTARRFLVLLVVAVLLVPVAPAAFAQTTPDPPATGGPSGTGGNTPAAGQTGGGTESPSTSGDSGGNSAVSALILVGLIALAVGTVLAIGQRHKKLAETGRPAVGH